MFNSNNSNIHIRRSNNDSNVMPHRDAAAAAGARPQTVLTSLYLFLPVWLSERLSERQWSLLKRLSERRLCLVV